MLGLYKSHIVFILEFSIVVTVKHIDKSIRAYCTLLALYMVQRHKRVQKCST